MGPHLPYRAGTRGGTARDTRNSLNAVFGSCGQGRPGGICPPTRGTKLPSAAFVDEETVEGGKEHLRFSYPSQILNGSGLMQAISGSADTPQEHMAAISIRHAQKRAQFRDRSGRDGAWYAGQNGYSRRFCCRWSTEFHDRRHSPGSGRINFINLRKR